MKIRKMILGVLTAVMLLAILPASEALAEETAVEVAEEGRTGYQQGEEKNLGIVAPVYYNTVTYNASEAEYWDKFGSDYFYNQMSSAERSFYDNLYAVCMKYLTTDADMIYQYWSDGTGDYIIDPISCGSLTQTQARDVGQIFQMQNPQFYFLSGGWAFGSTGYGNLVYSMTAYEDFGRGATRASKTSEMKARLYLWTKEIDKQPTVVEREKKAHDLIVNKVDYDHAFADDDPTTVPQSEYNQSCAGVFFEDYTVCAGYAEAFALLCNGAGIETISVTSWDHEWNQIKLYGRWYVVDCTWDDGEGSYWDYNYFNVSNATARWGNSSHYLESMWDGRGVPACDYDEVITTGAYIYNGVDYSAVFNEEYYLTKYPDLRKIFGNDGEKAFNHFVTNGMKEGRQGSAEFNVTSYRYQYADLRQIFGSDLKRYYQHYVTNGKREGRKGTGCTTLQNPITKYKGVDYSAVYDYNYYTTKYPDIKKALGANDTAVLAHFVNFGMKEGRQGNAAFSVISYRYQYADLRRAFGSNLKSYYMHYINSGRKEGRKGTGCTTLQNPTTIYKGIDYSAVYDFNYYTTRYSDIKRVFGNDENAVLAHFVNSGMREGRQGNASFNVQNYKNKYVDLRKAFGSDLKKYYMHYVTNGKKEGRTA